MTQGGVRVSDLGLKYPASSITQIRDNLNSTGKPKVSTVQNPEQGSFTDILQKVKNSSDPIRFSGHASSRLNSRGIKISDNQLERLNQAKNAASQKGIKDSLVLLDDLAFIVNVPNNTVVTAVDRQEGTSKIFTNIDGAVIA